MCNQPAGYAGARILFNPDSCFIRHNLSDAHSNDRIENMQQPDRLAVHAEVSEAEKAVSKGFV